MIDLAVVKKNFYGAVWRDSSFFFYYFLSQNLSDLILGMCILFTIYVKNQHERGWEMVFCVW